MSQIYKTVPGGGAGPFIMTITGNDGTANTPVANNMNLIGAAVANGTNALPLYVKDTATGTETIQLQYAAANATSLGTKAGIASFNSNTFSVDPNGFVSLVEVAPHYVAVTHNGTNPSPYTVLLTDYYISVDTTVVTPGPVSIILPMNPALYQSFVIKDRTGMASTNNITVSATGGALIDGAATYVMDGNFDSIEALWNGTTWEIF